MWTRSPNPATCWLVNPHLVRVLGSSTEVYLSTQPERTFELTRDTFEFLVAFASARPLHEVLSSPTPDQLQTVAGLVENGLLVPAEAKLAQPTPPRARPVSLRFCGAAPLISRPASPENEASLGDAVVVLGAKYDAGTLDRYHKGASRGPDAIRQESSQYPLFPDLRTGRVLGFPDVEARRYLGAGIRLLDAGDVQAGGGTPNTTWHQGLREELRGLRKRQAKVLLLGGDHSVSLASIQALQGSPLGVLQFDAHTDFGLVEHEAHLTHANVMRHVHREAHVAHLVCCGLRGFQQLPELEGVERYRSCSVGALRRMTSSELDEVLRPDLPYYVTVDIDVLDAPLVPGTAVPEPDG
ncbi:MAG TPA: arginase family protein, partial [Polyangiaceae bacterium]|nr:arginase family protein [Polyangiaceae bacterium]